MKCEQCKEEYDVKFDEDFIKGKCLPCQVQNRHDRWWAKVSNEIIRYSQLKNIFYDFNSFCYDCSVFKINVPELKDFKELKKVCKREREVWTEYWVRNQQLQLF